MRFSRTKKRDKALRKSVWQASEKYAGMLSVRLYTVRTSKEAGRELKKTCVKDSWKPFPVTRISCPVNMRYWPSVRSRLLDIGQVLTKPKNERGQNPAILTEQAWSITYLLYGWEENVFTGPTRKIPRGQDGPIWLLENPIRTKDSLHLARLWIQPYYKKNYITLK